MDSRSFFLVAAFFLSVAPIILSVTARSSIKRTRQGHIENLNKFFSTDWSSSPGKKADGSSDPKQVDPSNSTRPSTVDECEACRHLVKSLEFLKFKYEMPGAKPDKNGEQKPSCLSSTPFEIEPHAWLLSGLLLALVLSAFLSLAALVAAGIVSLAPLDKATPLEVYVAAHPSVSLTLLASIAGAYTYMVRAFYQAVNNFDLEPSSFFGAASNFIFAVIVTQIAVFYLAKSAEDASTGTAVLMIAAFIGAYMPDDILRYFLSLSSIKQLKQERSDFGREIDGIPIEVLDGIDSKIRYRLSDFHIESVQHLASTNPLMLFVETPYGFYETLDWVAQAQLCASVGPDALFKLWKLGIRTIFDLERAVLSPGFVNDKLVAAIERILLSDLTATPSVADASAPVTPTAIVGNVRMRIDGSDTRRLRLIVNCVNKQLGRGAVMLAEPRSRLVPG